MTTMSVLDRLAPPRHWPSLAEIGQLTGQPPSLAERLADRLRRARAAAVCQRLLAEAEHCAPLDALLRFQPQGLQPVLTGLVDDRLDAGQRADLLLNSLRGMAMALGAHRAAALVLGESLVLGPLPGGTQIALGRPSASWAGGVWALRLVGHGQVLLSLPFSFLTPDTLLLGAAVGAPAPVLAGHPGLVRRLTAEALGLPPDHLLLHVLRLCAQRWRVSDLWGVDPGHQIPAGPPWHPPLSAFWQDAGGLRRPDGHWLLPLVVGRRPLEDVDPGQRALLQARHDWLDRLDAGLAQVLAGPRAGGSVHQHVGAGGGQAVVGQHGGHVRQVQAEVGDQGFLGVEQALDRVQPQFAVVGDHAGQAQHRAQA